MSYTNKAWAAVYRQILNQLNLQSNLTKIALGQSSFALRAWHKNLFLLTSFFSGLYGWIEPRNPRNSRTRLSCASGNSPIPHQHKQKNRKIVSVWSGSASAQLKTVVSALSACIYTAERRWLAGHQPSAVRGPRVPIQTIPAHMGGGPSSYLAGNQWVGCTPPPHMLSTAGGQIV